jgi:glycosyltransferase involved in cell wall biosynthesis
MSVQGLLRCKNEERWIEACIMSLLPLCDMITVLDDHSTDGTPVIAHGLGCRVIPSNFTGCDEARDKNFLMLSLPQDTEWVVMIDGDEVLAPGAAETLQREMTDSKRSSISMDVLYLWDKPDQVRMDGVYGDFCRQSIFRPKPGVKFTGGPPPSFHCGNVPESIRFPYHRSKAQLLHYGYLNREDRLRKYRWYNEVDPNNTREDRYRHMVIGDEFPAETVTAHGGPLVVKPLGNILRVG